MFYTNIVVIASNKSRAETQSIKKGKQKNVIENHRNKMTDRNKGEKKKRNNGDRDYQKATYEMAGY